MDMLLALASRGELYTSELSDALLASFIQAHQLRVEGESNRENMSECIYTFQCYPLNRSDLFHKLVDQEGDASKTVQKYKAELEKLRDLHQHAKEGKIFEKHYRRPLFIKYCEIFSIEVGNTEKLNVFDFMDLIYQHHGVTNHNLEYRREVRVRSNQRRSITAQREMESAAAPAPSPTRLAPIRLAPTSARVSLAPYPFPISSAAAASEAAAEAVLVAREQRRVRDQALEEMETRVRMQAANDNFLSSYTAFTPIFRPQLRTPSAPVASRVRTLPPLLLSPRRLRLMEEEEEVQQAQPEAEDPIEIFDDEIRPVEEPQEEIVLSELSAKVNETLESVQSCLTVVPSSSSSASENPLAALKESVLSLQTAREALIKQVAGYRESLDAVAALNDSCKTLHKRLNTRLEATLSSCMILQKQVENVQALQETFAQTRSFITDIQSINGIQNKIKAVRDPLEAKLREAERALASSTFVPKTFHECTICCEDYTTEKPWSCLPCGHTACAACLGRMHQCHFCRVPFHVASIRPIYYSL